MGVQSNARPVIIKRKKIIAGGHHGGAWKVAYADFVTAMMAFFMLMWLLNATTEKQRKGIADYFAPTVAISRVSAGGDGAFSGDSLFSEESLARMGTGAMSPRPADSDKASGGSDPTLEAQKEALKQIEEALLGLSGESMVQETALKHVNTRITDEGLVVELFDLPDAVLFAPDSDKPTPLLEELARMLRLSFELVINPVAIEGHVPSRPVVVVHNPVWELSMTRADRMRLLLQQEGFEERRISRVTGHADRELAVTNPMAVRNNRLEVILLMQAD